MREAIHRWSYYSCHSSWDMSILCHVKSAIDINYLQKPSQAGTNSSNPSYLWKLPIYCYFGQCFRFKFGLKLILIVRMGNIKNIQKHDLFRVQGRFCGISALQISESSHLLIIGIINMIVNNNRHQPPQGRLRVSCNSFSNPGGVTHQTCLVQ